MDNEDFIAWANENVVVLVAHRDDGHKPVEEEVGKGDAAEKRTVCPLYPGLTCEQHQQASSDLVNAAEGMPKVPSPEGVPASFLISPTGELKEVSGADQQSAGKTQEIAEEFQKAFGDHLVLKKWEKYQEAFRDGDEAAEKGDWKAALKAYAVVDAALKKAPPALADQLAEKVKALAEKTTAAWAELRDGDADPVAKQKAAKDLLAKVTARLSSGPLPVKAEIEAWLKENKPAKP